MQLQSGVLDHCLPLPTELELRAVAGRQRGVAESVCVYPGRQLSAGGTRQTLSDYNGVLAPVSIHLHQPLNQGNETRRRQPRSLMELKGGNRRMDKFTFNIFHEGAWQNARQPGTVSIVL